MKKRGPHPRVFKCDDCDKILVSSPVYKRHMKDRKLQKRNSNTQQENEYIEGEAEVEPKVEPEDKEPLDCLEMTMKTEAEEEIPEVKPEVKEENEDATFICPLSSCTFMTNMFSDEVTLDHFKSAHPHMNTTDVKFMRL